MVVFYFGVFWVGVVFVLFNVVYIGVEVVFFVGDCELWLFVVDL